MRIWIATFAIVFLSVAGAFSQDPDTSKGVVLYDPIFWKDDLKLKTEQCVEIRAANLEFYERILDTFEESPHNREVLNQAITQCSIERSQQIWDIFSPRQRRRWTKLWTEKYASSKVGSSQGG
jgi:hypothetical protein